MIGKTVSNPPHRNTKSKDEELIPQELISKAFDYAPGRSHSCEKVDRIEPNVTTKVDKTKFFQWLSDLKKEQLNQWILPQIRN